MKRMALGIGFVVSAPMICAHADKELVNTLAAHARVSNHEANKALDQVYSLIAKHSPFYSKVYPCVYQFIKDKDLKYGCEVGVAWGGFSDYLLSRKSDVVLVGVDPYITSVQGKGSWGPDALFVEGMYLAACKRLAKHVKRNAFTFLRQTSLAVAPHYEDNTFDFVYLDADHLYRSVKADLQAWYSKVRPGGYIIGDDYSRFATDVARAVKEFTQERGLTYQVIGREKQTYVIQKPCS